MKLQHLSTIRGVDGLYDVDISIGDKIYTYRVESSYAISLFIAQYRTMERRERERITLSKHKGTDR